MKHKASFSHSLSEEIVQCRLCPSNCRLTPGQRGLCHNRFNENGELFTENFGETVTIAIDPIEKKPLYHFLPASDIVSIGANGCNLFCKHCQNWQISQRRAPTTYIAPEDLPEVAGQKDSVGVAYTYTEPMIWYEYIMQAAPRIKDAGLVNVMVSNGYINPEPLKSLLPHIDAYNIDIKGMRPEFYRRVCKGKLEPVLETIRAIGASQAHMELTNLVITDLNDSDEDFHKLGEFIVSVDKNIPLHISAYYPTYELDNPATSTETLLRAYNILKDYLTYVFVGNRNLPGCSDSTCPSCNAALIRRVGYQIRVVGLNDNGTCSECGAVTGIVTKSSASSKTL
ncbi:MAG: AmmeMemoRadiSam system radical SAM enzyme [Candidatus Zixiibacteriota bacterium]